MLWRVSRSAGLVRPSWWIPVLLGRSSSCPFFLLLSASLAPYAMHQLLVRKDDWYLAGPVCWRHCFPLGRPFLSNHSSGDNCCRVHPYHVHHFDSSAPNHSIAPAIIPTCGSVEWVVQPLWQGFAPSSPMHRRVPGLLVVSSHWSCQDHTTLCLWNGDMAYHSSLQTTPTDDAQKSLVSR